MGKPTESCATLPTTQKCLVAYRGRLNFGREGVDDDASGCYLVSFVAL